MGESGLEWEPTLATTTATACPDLVVTNFESETHSLFRNLGKGLFADATFESGVGPVTLPFLGFGVAFFDYDNDADLDLAIANGHVLDNTRLFRSTSRYAQRNLLLRNDANGRFTDVGLQSGPAWALEKVSRALASGDIDNDGDLDLLVSNNGQPPDLLRNDGGARSGNALLIRLRGRESNRDGIGAMRHGHGRVAAAGSRGARRVQLPRAE